MWPHWFPEPPGCQGGGGLTESWHLWCRLTLQGRGPCQIRCPAPCLGGPLGRSSGGAAVGLPAEAPPLPVPARSDPLAPPLLLEPSPVLQRFHWQEDRLSPLPPGPSGHVSLRPSCGAPESLQGHGLAHLPPAACLPTPAGGGQHQWRSSCPRAIFSWRPWMAAVLCRERDGPGSQG